MADSDAGAKVSPHDLIGRQPNRRFHSTRPLAPVGGSQSHVRRDVFELVELRERQRTQNARAIAVLPTYNERDNLTELIPVVLEDRRFDVLVVDDNSPDGTADAVEMLKNDFPGRVHLIRRPGKLGLGTAYLEGFHWALTREYDLICEMDADFSHDPHVLPRLADATCSADLVLGSRYVPGGKTVNWSTVRRMLSRGGSAYARAVLGLQYQDLTGGFKCFRRQVLESIDLDSVDSTGYAFQIEMTYRAHQAGFRVIEIPITFHERRAGCSKMDSSIVAEALLRVWLMRLPRREAIPFVKSHASRSVS
jgi:dolichol-phosphate mannosyltransferase